MSRTSFLSLLTAIAISATQLPAADAALPKVLILGDSISIGYTPLVVEGMKGKAVVSRPKANCGDTRRQDWRTSTNGSLAAHGM